LNIFQFVSNPFPKRARWTDCSFASVSARAAHPITRVQTHLALAPKPALGKGEQMKASEAPSDGFKEKVVIKRKANTSVILLQNQNCFPSTGEEE